MFTEIYWLKLWEIVNNKKNSSLIISIFRPKKKKNQYLICVNFLQLELKLGIGGTSYKDFIQSLHLPMQLRFNNISSYVCICGFIERMLNSCVCSPE